MRGFSEAWATILFDGTGRLATSCFRPPCVVVLSGHSRQRLVNGKGVARWERALESQTVTKARIQPEAPNVELVERMVRDGAKLGTRRYCSGGWLGWLKKKNAVQ